MNGRSFKQFCINTVTPEHVDIIPSGIFTPDKMYVNIVNSIKPKMEILDRVNIPFIEATFEDMDAVTEILREDQDVPDEMLGDLSTKLYGKEFNTLDNEEQSIIKVIGCYLQIQTIIRRNLKMTNHIITNEANIKPIPVDLYNISAAEVVNHLQDKLGFALKGYDFTRWMGADVENSYVRFRAVFDYNDIVAKSTDSSYVARVLEQNAASIKFKDSVIKTLKPFMYPKNISDDPDTLNRLRCLGIFEDRLRDLITNSQLRYNQEANVFIICLGPEYILRKMLSDPVTGEVPGKFEIISVLGTSTETIRWKIIVTENVQTTRNTDFSLDALFNTPTFPCV